MLLTTSLLITPFSFLSRDNSTCPIQLKQLLSSISRVTSFFVSLLINVSFAHSRGASFFAPLLNNISYVHSRKPRTLPARLLLQYTQISRAVAIHQPPHLPLSVPFLPQPFLLPPLYPHLH